MLPYNRYNKPVAPLNGEYHLPAPPRHSLPGTKTAKDKAGHVCLSVACSVGLVVVWRLVLDQTINACFGVLMVPLLIGAVWGFIPLLQDWIITYNLARHSYTYNSIHQMNAEELRAVSEEWSVKHNGANHSRQEIELTRRQKEERLEAENRRLLAIVARRNGGIFDLDTEHLEDLE